MYVSAEVQLIVLIFLLYLYDVIVPVYHNEVVAHRLPSGYRVVFPRNRATFGRRLLIRLPLLTPFYPAYRLVWPLSSPPEAAAPNAAWVKAFRAQDAFLFSRLMPGTLLLALGVLLFIPLGLYCLPILYVLAALPFLYLVIFFQLYQLARFRAVYPLTPLSREKFCLLAVECLICPPSAVNLVRKVSLNLSPAVDLITFAEALLSPKARQQAVSAVVERIGEQLLLVEDMNAPEARQMQAHAARLQTRFQLPKEDYPA